MAIRRTRPDGRRGFRRSADDPHSATATGAPAVTDSAAIMAEAMAQLARRDFASAALAAKLESRGCDRDGVATVIAELQTERVLDDARFAENLVASHARRGHGPFRIRQELRALGVADEALEAALREGPDWHLLARSVRKSKFGADAPVDRAEAARQARFLQYRGFSTDHIRSALGRDLDP